MASGIPPSNEAYPDPSPEVPGDSGQQQYPLSTAPYPQQSSSPYPQQSSAPYPTTAPPSYPVKDGAPSGYSAQDASPGYLAQGASPGYSAQDASPGYSAQGASPGYPAQGASPGYSAQGASPGYSAQGASPGYLAQGASPGYSAQGASPAYLVQGASPGYSAQGASPGYPVQGASPRYPAQGASLGYPAQGISPEYLAQGASPGPGYLQQCTPPGYPGYQPQGAAAGYTTQGVPVHYNQANNQTTIITQQPAAGGHTMVAQVHPNYQIAASIISIFFCFFIGIFALNNAIKSRERLRMGDNAGATRFGMSARRLAMIAIVLGIFILPIVIVVPGTIMSALDDVDD